VCSIPKREKKVSRQLRLIFSTVRSRTKDLGGLAAVDVCGGLPDLCLGHQGREKGFSQASERAGGQAGEGTCKDEERPRGRDAAVTTAAAAIAARPCVTKKGQNSFPFVLAGSHGRRSRPNPKPLAAWIIAGGSNFPLLPLENAADVAASSAHITVGLTHASHQGLSPALILVHIYCLRYRLASPWYRGEEKSEWQSWQLEGEGRGVVADDDSGGESGVYSARGEAS